MDNDEATQVPLWAGDRVRIIGRLITGTHASDQTLDREPTGTVASLLLGQGALVVFDVPGPGGCCLVQAPLSALRFSPDEVQS